MRGAERLHEHYSNVLCVGSFVLTKVVGGLTRLVCALFAAVT
jgi:hypothetical protein